LKMFASLPSHSLTRRDPEKNSYLRHPDNEPFFHIQVALGLQDGSARGGHLFEAVVRPTVELVLTTFPRPLRRKIDRETGLPLLTPD